MGMSRGYARFTQADVHRAIKAVVQSGADMVVTIATDGSMQIARNAGLPVTAAAHVESRPRRVP